MSVVSSNRVESAPRTGATDSADDRARQPSGWEREVAVTELSQSELAVRTWACTATSLTRSGLMLRSRPMVHSGRLLIIRMPAAASPEPKLLYGVVKGSKYQIGKGYEVEVEFCAKPRPASLQMHERGQAWNPSR